MSEAESNMSDHDWMKAFHGALDDIVVVQREAADIQRKTAANIDRLEVALDRNTVTIADLAESVTRTSELVSKAMESSAESLRELVNIFKREQGNG